MFRQWIVKLRITSKITQVDWDGGKFTERWREKERDGVRGRAYGSRNEKWIKHNTVLEDGPHCSAFSGMSRNTITCLMREPMQFSAYTQITAENMRYSGGLLEFICIPAVLNENGVLCCCVRVWFSDRMHSQGPICLIVDLPGNSAILNQIPNHQQCICSVWSDANTVANGASVVTGGK